jgi:hypothetical protein
MLPKKKKGKLHLISQRNPPRNVTTSACVQLTTEFEKYESKRELQGKTGKSAVVVGMF